ncbi:unnamed protein product [Euphydryas editha]|uniref:Transposase n=1 Tax=Euphydryas editha TaxID=104508 RepID=A0AAU9UFI5_EUPED|nr:unnamed protein product [Euphydryas editha]
MGKYTRKTNRGSYSKETLSEAVREVQSGRMSGYAASQKYGVPRMTIMDHVNRKRGISKTLGRNTALSPDIERNLATSLHTMEKYGFALSRKEVLQMVGDYVKKNTLITPFKNGIPRKDWFLAFRKRQGLSLKKPQGIEYARKTAIDPFIVFPYFDLLEKTIRELNLTDKPEAIWNIDETSFSKDPAKTKVVGAKGHAATRVISSPGRDNTTVLLGANAAGDKAPPLIIYKGKNVWDTWISPDAYPGTSYAATKNGWMETEIFEMFFKKTFIPLINDQRPILLIYDGHSTHVGLNIIEEARKENVTILKLPPHSSHVLQPLDIAVMKSFKDRWDPLLVEWQRLHVGSVLPKSELARLIGKVWAEIDTQVLRNGFRKAGIFPTNRKEINEDKFDMLKLRQWKEFENKRHGLTEEQIVTKKNPKSLMTIVTHFLQKALETESVGNSRESNDCTSEKKIFTQDHNVSFEELLLQKLKRGDNSPKPKRSKVAPGAEVITHDEVLEKKREEKKKSLKTNSNEEKKKGIKKTTIGTRNKKPNQDNNEQKQNLIPYANIKKGKKKEFKNKTQNENKKEVVTQDDAVINLRNIPKHDTQLQTFVAKDATNLPHCLQKKVRDSKKIKVISNIIIKKADNGTAKKKEGEKEKKCQNNHIKSQSTEKKKQINIYENPKPGPSRPKRRHFSTSVSESISIYSDSDIETDFLEEDEDYFNNAKMSPTSSIDNGKEINDNKDIQNVNYSPGDNVIVRYYMRQKWMYYLGIIENTKIIDEELCYSIKFYKTIKKPKLTFKMTKTTEHDDIPEKQIVKKIDLIRSPPSSNSFFMSSDENEIYF